MLTFREFYEICEGKKPDTPPHAVSGTVNRDSSGTLTYTLQSYDGPKRKPTKKEIDKFIVSRSGGKKVKKHAKRIAKIIEDIETRRSELRKKHKESIEREKNRAAQHRLARQEKMEKEAEREEIKKEVERELRDR